MSADSAGRDLAGLSTPELVEMYVELHKIRCFLDRLVEVFREGKIPGALHPGTGHEGIVVGSAHALRPSDYVIPSHRSIMGFLRLRGVSWRAIWAECMGKATGVAQGMRSEALIGSFDDSIRVWPVNPILGHGMPQAAGAAIVLKERGKGEVFAAYMGDGYSAAGTVWEACHFAGIYKLPIIIVVENNQYAYSTPFSRMSPIANISERAAAFGFPGVTIDGNDVVAVYQTIREAADRARAGLGPTLVECRTYRLVGHFVGDPEVYRAQEEVNQWRERCPVKRQRELVLGLGAVTEDELVRAEQANAQEIEADLELALADPYLDPREILQRSYVGGEYPEGYSS